MTLNYYYPIFIAMLLCVLLLIGFIMFLKYTESKKLNNSVRDISTSGIFHQPLNEKLSITFFRKFPRPIILLDEDGTIIDLNRQCEKELGLTREDYKNVHIHKIIPTFFESPKEGETMDITEGESITYSSFKLKCYRSSHDVIRGYAVII